MIMQATYLMIISRNYLLCSFCVCFLFQDAQRRRVWKYVFWRQWWPRTLQIRFLQIRNQNPLSSGQSHLLFYAWIHATSCVSFADDDLWPQVSDSGWKKFRWGLCTFVKDEIYCCTDYDIYAYMYLYIYSSVVMIALAVFVCLQACQHNCGLYTFQVNYNHSNTVWLSQQY